MNSEEGRIVDSNSLAITSKREQGSFSEVFWRLLKVFILTVFFLGTELLLLYIAGQVPSGVGFVIPKVCQILAFVSYVLETVAISLGISLRVLLMPAAATLASLARMMDEVDKQGHSERFPINDRRVVNEFFPGPEMNVGVQAVSQT